MGFRITPATLGTRQTEGDWVQCPVCKGTGWRCRCFTCGGARGLKPTPCTCCGGGSVPDKGGSGRVRPPRNPDKPSGPVIPV